MTDDLNTLLRLCAIGAIADRAPEANRLLECAIRDKDDLPAVKVTLVFTVCKSGESYTADIAAKAERTQLAKADKRSIEWNPNQPELFKEVE